MKINFKFLVIPLSFSVIYCSSSNINAMENSEIYQFCDNQISLNEWKEIFLSFSEEQKLTESQAQIIVCMSEAIHGVFKNISNLHNYMKSSKSENPGNDAKDKYYNDFLKVYFPQDFNDKNNIDAWYMKSEDPANPEYNSSAINTYQNLARFLSIDLCKYTQLGRISVNVNNNDMSKYLAFIKKIKECYKAKIIDKDHYISLLSYLLFCNTNRMFNKLNQLINTDKSIYKEKSHTPGIVVNETIDNFIATLLDDYFTDSNTTLSITQFILNCIYGGLQNCFTKLYKNVANYESNPAYQTHNNYAENYEMYKSVMQNIIRNLILVLISGTDISNSNELVLILHQIMEPIRLGIYTTIHNTFENKTVYESDKTIKQQTRFNNRFADYYNKIMQQKNFTDKIDKELNISPILNEYIDAITYLKFIYDRQNDGNKKIPVGSFALIKDKVITINENKKTYKHSDKVINNKQGNNNINLITGIMKYVSKPAMFGTKAERPIPKELITLPEQNANNNNVNNNTNNNANVEDNTNIINNDNLIAMPQQNINNNVEDNMDILNEYVNMLNFLDDNDKSTTRNDSKRQ